MIAISLRTKVNFSYFKNNLLGILSCPHFNKVVICSGYFQENLYGYSISSDDLLSTILANSNYPNIEYIIIGGQFYNSYKLGKSDWHIAFDDFLRTLSHNGINFTAFIEKRKKWHAKISLGLENDIPKVAIIGSSNITRPAYSDSYTTFNVECDTTLLVNEKKIIKHFNLEEFTNEDPLSPIIAKLDDNYTQANLLERLQAVTNEVLSNDSLEQYTDF